MNQKDWLAKYLSNYSSHNTVSVCFAKAGAMGPGSAYCANCGRNLNFDIYNVTEAPMKNERRGHCYDCLSKAEERYKCFLKLKAEFEK